VRVTVFGTSRERLTIVEGDARDPDVVVAAVRGSEAIILGLSLMNAEDEPEYSEATSTIVEAAEREGVRRIVVTANNDVFGDDEVTGSSRRTRASTVATARP
jgi:uncharacterized protein YbjT (DUF2867 family)